MDDTHTHDQDCLLKLAEVAAYWRVKPNTVANWALLGRIWSMRTPAGQRRYCRYRLARS